ncbi:MAG: hypothetical protein K0S35_1390 [Geminicoccaceae bacterium]|nr:hypothetical protein [Geminicoccaceae bacterium]
MRAMLWLLSGVTGCAIGVAHVETIKAATAAPALDRLIQQFNAGAPEQDGVEIDAWTETGPEGRAIVVVVAPRGATKLVADPGITVTPTARPGLAWSTALPYRKVEPEVDYFTPPATLRLPFTSSDREPVELLVEYAWCVVDFQCFFGEETLKVAIN